ncbi:MAG: 5-formyltetrahydrofolate cyclo-ligase [Pikeienuella sp.]
MTKKASGSLEDEPFAALVAAKAEMRKEIFAARGAAHAERAIKDPRANAALFDAVTAHTTELNGKIIAIYQPMRTEISPLAAAENMFKAGARLCTPVIIAKGQPLKFREWTPGCLMEEGTFGAQVPVSGEWLTPDIVVAPLVGWDRRGGRLGYGGGFYDRTLEGLRALRPTPAIGYAYAMQEVAEAPQEPTDQPLNAIVTEAETILFGKGA